MDIDQALRDAQANAQGRFHEMLEAGVHSLPDHPLTIAYEAAERYVDALLAVGQAYVEAEARRVRQPRSGDHHIYPAGVGK